MIRALFGPSNSLVLAVDPVAMPRFELEEALDDIGRYYRFGTLSEAAGRRGMAAVVFPEARKRHFLNYTPLIRSMDIPVTIFVQPECVGVTRLPLWEELSIYREHFAAFPDEPHLLDRAWTDAAWAEAKIVEARGLHGPLPYDHLDPMRFYGRWRDLGDFPPEKLEVGLDLPVSVHPGHEARLREAVAFAKSQAKRPLRYAIGRDAVLDDAGERWLGDQGFVGYVSGLSGPVLKGTNPWRLPRWPLERSQAEENA